MSNSSVTKVDIGKVVLEEANYEDDLLTFGGAGTVLAGTILARDSSTSKLIPFVKGGSTNGNGIPKAILTYDVTATGAGDISIRYLQNGEVVKERLIIDADGDGSNIDAAVLDQLRDYGIIARSVTELNQYDNGA